MRKTGCSKRPRKQIATEPVTTKITEADLGPLLGQLLYDSLDERAVSITDVEAVQTKPGTDSEDRISRVHTQLKKEQTAAGHYCRTQFHCVSRFSELSHPWIQARRAEIGKSLEGNRRPELIVCNRNSGRTATISYSSRSGMYSDAT